MKDTAKTLAGQGVIYALQLTFTVIVARLLGPASQGEFALLRTATYLGEPLLWLGLTSGLPYLVAKDSAKYHDPLLKAAAGYLAVALLVISATLSLLSDHPGRPGALGIVAGHRGTFLLWLASLALLQLLQRTFLAQQRFGDYNTAFILNAAVAFPALLALSLVQGVNVTTAAGASIFANVVALAYAVWAHRAHLDSARRSTVSLLPAVREAYAIGIKGYVSGIAFLVLYRLDFFFVAQFLGNDALGVYAVAVFVVEGMQKVPDWLALMLTPQVAAGRDPDGRLARRYATGALASVATLGILLASVTAWQPGILGLVLGTGYEGVAALLVLLLPRAMMHAVMATHAGYLAGRAYTLYHPLAGLAGLAVLCLVDVVAIPRYELKGAVGGITAAYAVTTAVMWLGYRAQRLRVSAA